jgi:hypothetical protein
MYSTEKFCSVFVDKTIELKRRHSPINEHWAKPIYITNGGR